MFIKNIFINTLHLSWRVHKNCLMRRPEYDTQSQICTCMYCTQYWRSSPKYSLSNSRHRYFATLDYHDILYIVHSSMWNVIIFSICFTKYMRYIAYTNVQFHPYRSNELWTVSIENTFYLNVKWQKCICHVLHRCAWVHLACCIKSQIIQ